MAKKLYVGNLSYGTSEDGLRAAFGQYGEVQSVNIVIDRDSGRSKGFGFVEMSDDNAAMAAITGMNGRELDGRSLRVNEANERPPRRDYGNRW
ncbi:MAG TPA: RNA-binding protein [bacterium]|nr:RNA-binding protein [bacterium]